MYESIISVLQLIGTIAVILFMVVSVLTFVGFIFSKTFKIVPGEESIDDWLDQNYPVFDEKGRHISWDSNGNRLVNGQPT